MSQFDAAERFVIALAFKVILYVLCGSLTGCDAVGGVLASSRGVPQSLAFLAIVDKALEMQRPELPDDLEKGSGEVPSAAPKDNRPEVLAYVTTNCSYCEKMKKDVEKYDKIRFKFIDKAPEWVTSFPTLHWKGRDGWRQMSGWTDLRTFLAEWQKSLKEVPVNYSATPNGSYPVHAQRWNINGNWSPSRAEIIRHLLSDGMHRGRFSRQYLESLSRAELLSAHDDHHEGRMQWAYATRPQASGRTYRRARTRACPTCPS